MSVLKYEDDTRTATMAEIEEILLANYGDSDYDRECGCIVNGSWLSIDRVLGCIAAEL